jgi:hypothetical protein
MVTHYNEFQLEIVLCNFFLLRNENFNIRYETELKSMCVLVYRGKLGATDDDVMHKIKSINKENSWKMRPSSAAGSLPETQAFCTITRRSKTKMLKKHLSIS